MICKQIETEEAAQDTPKADMEKRAAARADKKQKLKNPLFFISPHRLSVRNLSRTVTDATLKKLFVDAARTGLAKKKATEKVTLFLVTASIVTFEHDAHPSEV
jgi:hypothetical protein